LQNKALLVAPRTWGYYKYILRHSIHGKSI